MQATTELAVVYRTIFLLMPSIILSSKIIIPLPFTITFHFHTHISHYRRRHIHHTLSTVLNTCSTMKEDGKTLDHISCLLSSPDPSSSVPVTPSAYVSVVARRTQSMHFYVQMHDLHLCFRCLCMSHGMFCMNSACKCNLSLNSPHRNNLW